MNEEFKQSVINVMKCPTLLYSTPQPQAWNEGFEMKFNIVVRLNVQKQMPTYFNYGVPI